MKFRERPYLESYTIAGHKKKHKEKVSKIQVPFYCMYSETDGNGKRMTEKKLGKVNCDGLVPGLPLYVLEDMSQQRPITESNVVAKRENVTDLIKEYGINIGKVEIIFWED